jgi:hypothetical protein
MRKLLEINRFCHGGVVEPAALRLGKRAIDFSRVCSDDTGGSQSKTL